MRTHRTRPGPARPGRGLAGAVLALAVLALAGVGPAGASATGGATARAPRGAGSPTALAQSARQGMVAPPRALVLVDRLTMDEALAASGPDQPEVAGFVSTLPVHQPLASGVLSLAAGRRVDALAALEDDPAAASGLPGPATVERIRRDNPGARFGRLPPTEVLAYPGLEVAGLFALGPSGPAPPASLLGAGGRPLPLRPERLLVLAVPDAAALADLLGRLEPTGDAGSIMVVGLRAAPGRANAAPLLVLQRPGAGGGTVTSNSTRRLGLVALEDVRPTLTGGASAGDDGAVMRLAPVEGPVAAAVTRLDRRVGALVVARTWAIPLLCLAAVLALFALLAVWRARRRGSGADGPRPLARSLLALTLALPPGYLVASMAEPPAARVWQAVAGGSLRDPGVIVPWAVAWVAAGLAAAAALAAIALWLDRPTPTPAPFPLPTPAPGSVSAPAPGSVSAPAPGPVSASGPGPVPSPMPGPASGPPSEPASAATSGPTSGPVAGPSADPACGRSSAGVARLYPWVPRLVPRWGSVADGRATYPRRSTAPRPPGRGTYPSGSTAPRPPGPATYPSGSTVPGPPAPAAFPRGSTASRPEGPRAPGLRDRLPVRVPAPVLLGVVLLGLVALDLALGGDGLAQPLLGGSAWDGERFYGLGNGYFAFALAAAMLVVGFAPLPAVPAAVLLGGLGMVDGLPRLGADVGGALTAMLTGAAALIVLAPNRPRPGRALLLAGLAVAAAVAVALGAGLGGPVTHAGRFAERLQQGPADAVGVVVDQLARNLRLLANSPFAWVGPLQVAAAALIALRPPAGLADLPVWIRRVLGLGALGSLLLILLNDTGVTATAASGLFLLAIPAWAWLDGVAGPAPAPPAAGSGRPGS
jgi:hypothetical protein